MSDEEEGTTTVRSPANPKYRVEFTTRSASFVGYMPRENVMVEYWFDRNYIFYTCPPKMGTNLGVCPIENLNFGHVIELGEL